MSDSRKLIGGLTLAQFAAVDSSGGGASLATRELTLLGTMSGGPSGIIELYSVLGGVSSSSGVVDSVAGRKGVGPNLAATLTVRPAWDPVSLLITGDGSNDRLSFASNDATVDFSTLKTVVTVGVWNDANAKYFLGVTDSLSENRSMYLSNNITDIFTTAGGGGSFGSVDTGVAKSATRRVVVSYHNGSTTTTGDVLAHGTVNATITALASGSNRLTIFDYFPAGGLNSTGPWRATVLLNYVPTAGDLTILGTWAVNYHAAVLAA